MEVRRSFHEELQQLIAQLLMMGDMVEQSIAKSIKALKEQDLELARQVVEEDDAIDALELEIEAKCLELIARQQPMAKDLRKIATALKIITDLERIADHACNIAEACLKIGKEPLIKPLVDIPRMADLSRGMLKKALDSYANNDVQLAYEVCRADDEVDSLHNQVFRELLTYMMQDPKNIQQATHLLFISSYLERIGDYTTNLAEWLIYMVTGERKRLND